MKETLVNNLSGNNDLSDTIQSIKDDEIQDTFDDDIDSENLETPPIQRKAMRYAYDRPGMNIRTCVQEQHKASFTYSSSRYRQRSLRLPTSSRGLSGSLDFTNGGGSGSGDHLTSSESDLSNRSRRNPKFRTLGSSGSDGGKPLGDRELMLKKARAASADLENRGDDDDLGAGLFDR